jgi:hypothetical protein
MSQPKKPSRGKEAEKRELTRRAVLAGLGIGAALPAMSGFAQTAQGSENYEAAKKKFDEYWKVVEPILKSRDHAMGAEREKYDLHVHGLRDEFLKSTNKSGFPMQCSFGTPTPLPLK